VATVEDVRRVAPLVLAHRRRRQPFDDPGISQEEIDDALNADSPESQFGENGENRSGDSGASDKLVGADTPTKVVPLSAPRDTTGTRASGRRSVVQSGRGRIVGDKDPAGTLNDVAIGPTVRAAALRRADSVEEQAVPGQRSLVAVEDLREAIREEKTGNLLILAVDASGSMGVQHRMEAVKGAVLSLLLDAYQRRDRVALVTFSGEKGDVVLRPTGSVEIARTRMESLATGGKTPLASGIEMALSLAKGAPESHQPFLIVISDGRATSSPTGSDPVEAALSAASLVRQHSIPSVVIDVEDGPTRLGLAATLAQAMGAQHLLLPELSAGSLTSTIRQVVSE
jgi:magnesium chelatase subunit D